MYRMPTEGHSSPVHTPKLRFCNSDRADLGLGPGVHAIGRDDDGELCRVDDASAAIAQICVDRRGIWLQLRDGVRGLHVNGRPVRRMSMLRAGDAVFIDGVELLVLGAEPIAAPQAGWPQPEVPEGSTGVVLRGIGGIHHGRCFVVAQRLTIGRRLDSDVRIHAAAIDDLARLEAHVDGVVLRSSAQASSRVNGWPVHDALLRAGDHLVLAEQHRFALEAATCPAAMQLAHEPLADAAALDEAAAHGESQAALMGSVRRLPWLLLAAAMLAAALSLLLIYGVR